MKEIHINILAVCLISVVLLSACSVTKHLPEGEVLVVDEQQLFAADQRVHRNQLHAGDQVSLALILGHEGPGPGGSVLDKGTGKWNAGFIGIPDGVCDA